MTVLSVSPPRTSLQSINRHLLWGVIATVLLVFGVGGWAGFTELSGAVIANGQLVVDSSAKKVQHPTGGIVGELRVKEGQLVKQGEVVVRLDETQTRANLLIITKALDELAARQARDEAERDGADKVNFPADLLARLSDPDVNHAVTGEQKLFETRKSARDGQKAQLREQIAQLEEQIRGNKEQEAAKAKEVSWIQQELKGIRDLWQKQLIPFNRVTSLERDAARIEGERAGLIASIAQAKGKISEIQLKIIQVDEDLRTEVGKDLADVRAKKSELTERRVAAEDQLKRIDLVAPIDGKVFQRNVNTVGGVIQAGETLMLIVPNEDALQIEAKIQPHDIDQVSVGQEVIIRFPSFSQRTTPELNGVVTRIGADVTQDEKKNESFYTVRINVPESEIARLGKNVKLMPGMPAEAFIQTSPRTAFAYIVKPMHDQIVRAFKER